MIPRCSIEGDVVSLVLALISADCGLVIDDSIGRREWWEGVITVCDQSMYD
jgi:hypothetical protein